MDGYTHFTKLSADTELKTPKIKVGLTEADYKVTSDDAPAAGDSYTKADYAKTVALVNELKADYNKLLKQLITGSDT